MALEKEKVKAAEAEALGKWADLVVSNLFQIPDDATSVEVENWESESARLPRNVAPAPPPTFTANF